MLISSAADGEALARVSMASTLSRSEPAARPPRSRENGARGHENDVEVRDRPGREHLRLRCFRASRMAGRSGRSQGPGASSPRYRTADARRSGSGGARSETRGRGRGSPPPASRPSRTACANVMAPVHTRAMAARVGGDHEVDVEPGILQADVRSAALEDQPARPEGPAPRRERAKVEADDDASVGQPVEGDAPPHVPHEQRQVEVVGVELGGGPPLTPFPEPLQDLAELLGRRASAGTPVPGRGRAGWLWTTPASSSSRSRWASSVREIRGMPCRISLNRRAPASSSRRISGVQRSAKVSHAIAIGQNWP